MTDLLVNGKQLNIRAIIVNSGHELVELNSRWYTETGCDERRCYLQACWRYKGRVITQHDINAIQTIISSQNEAVTAPRSSTGSPYPYQTTAAHDSPLTLLIFSER